jgi:Uma2 family endonuclease
MTDTETTYQPITIDAYMAIDGRAEVVGGKLIQRYPSELAEVLIYHSIYDRLNSFVSECALGEVYIKAAYVLDVDERTNLVQAAFMPDISFIAADRLEAHLEKWGEESPIRVAPALAIEIISPNDRFNDVMEKIEQYLFYGVSLVIVIQPKRKRTLIYSPDFPNGKCLTDADTLTAEPVIPGWSIALADVFGSKG